MSASCRFTVVDAGRTMTDDSGTWIRPSGGKRLPRVVPRSSDARSRAVGRHSGDGKARRDLRGHGTRDKRIERAREARERVQLYVWPRIGVLAEPVDPDGAQPKLSGRRDVVEETRGYVHVPGAVGTGSREELLPVSVSRLVGADLRGDDRELEGNTDPTHRRVDVIAVGVGENGELPPAPASLLERRLHLRKRLPPRQRPCECVLVIACKRDVLAIGELHERPSEHVAIRASGVLALDLRLDLVVGMQERSRALGSEETLELPADAAVPVDERAIAVEGRPPVHTSHHG